MLHKFILTAIAEQAGPAVEELSQKATVAGILLEKQALEIIGNTILLFALQDIMQGDGEVM